MKYTRVASECEEKDDVANLDSLKHRRSTQRRVVRNLIVVVGMVLISCSFFAFVLRQRLRPIVSHCGTSPQEASSLGCIFDVSSFTWLSPACADEELTHEFLTVDNWQWYSDVNRTEQLDVGLVAKGMFDSAFVSKKYHLYHCTYMWRKLHRAILRKSPVDGYIGNYAHTTHCEMMLTTPDIELEGSNTIINLKYAECPRLKNDLTSAKWYRMENGVKVFGHFSHHDHAD